MLFGITIRRYDRIKKIEQLALQYEVENSLFYMYLAWADAERNEYDLAEQYMGKAVRLKPEDKQIRDEYLEALQVNNKFYRAILKPVKMLQKLKNWQIIIKHRTI